MQTAKFLPPCPLHILQRERLVNRLLAWEDRKLVIIHGQAGQGKSTLAADLVKSFRLPFIWYNLDREDDNPSVFLSSLASSLYASTSSLVPRPLALPGSGLDGAGIEQTVRRWIRSAFAQVTKPFLIVFDDLNPGTCGAMLLQLLQALIEETPPAVRFLLLSRSRPELRLSALRAKRGVAELSGDELKFTDDEVLDLFGSVFGMHLAPQEAAVINRKIEGWPVGLVLMHEYIASVPRDAESLRRADSADSAFHSHIFEYLAQQVFSHLPEDLQQFLLRTSVPDYLPEPLQRELWLPVAGPGGKSAACLIAELNRRNLFVTPLSSDTGMIRYHPLFREYLRKKLLASAAPSDVRRLYARAADWFRSNGDPVRAVDLLLDSGQVRKACSLIERSAATLIARGQAGTMLRWRAALPAGEQGGPWYILAAALSCRFTDSRAALSLFEAAFRQFNTAAACDRDSGRMLALCGLIEACFHSNGDFARMARAAALAQTLLARKRSDRSVRARLLLAQGMAWFFLGRLEKSRPALIEALECFRKQGDPFHQITCAVYLAPCALYQGDFRLARQSLARGNEAHALIPDDAASSAALLLTMAMTALFEGNFSEARDCIDRCRSMAGHHALESIEFLSLDIEGWLLLAVGEYDAAARLLTECLRKAEKNNHPFYIASATHLLAIIAMFRGRLAEAKKLSDRALAIRSQSNSRLFHAVYRVVHGAILLKIGGKASAEKELRTALRMLQQARALQEEANAHLMLALLYRKTKRVNLFHKHLRAGFSIGRDLGFRYYAPLTGDELAGLARAAVEECICEDYCRGILDSSSKTAVPLLTLHCMGGFRVFRGRKEIPEAEWKSKLGKTLLKMLAAAEESGFPRERAMEMLWPGAPPEKSRPQFNTLFHRLRKTLQPADTPGRDIFCIDRGGDLIALNSGAVRIDSRQFQAAVEQAKRIKLANRPPDLLKEYEQCIGLYRGDFLPEDLYHDWATETRDRLRADYLRMLEEAGDLAESMGEKSKAQQLFEKMFLTDPCSEKACRWLMTRYFSLGRKSEAVRVYERCERALSTELELEPEEKTKKLYRSIIGTPG